jgi:hypothetical protein
VRRCSSGNISEESEINQKDAAHIPAEPGAGRSSPPWALAVIVNAEFKARPAPLDEDAAIAGAAELSPWGLSLYERLMDTDRVSRNVNQHRLRKLMRRQMDAATEFCSHDAGSCSKP